MTTALELRGLTKHYGRKQVLDSIDLSVEEGSVFGFLGPNGSGKTTTLRLVTGQARATTGTIRIFGSEAQRGASSRRTQIGFLPDVPAFYDWMTAPEFLQFAGELFDMERRVLRDRVELLLDLAGLSNVGERIGGFSRGMRQRLGIAQALIHSPRLLLLDEPTSALDPIGRKEVLELVSALRGRTTVFFSTHLLGDVERVCDTVAVPDRGRVLTQAPIHDLLADAGVQRLRLVLTGGADRLVAALRTTPWARDVTLLDEPGVPGIEFVAVDPETAHLELPRVLAAHDLGLVSLSNPERTLEDVFVDLVQRGSS